MTVVNLATTTHPGTASTVADFIVGYWWLAFIIIPIIGTCLEGVRDFFLDGITDFMAIRHRHRMAEIKAQMKLLARHSALAEQPTVLSPCRHHQPVAVLNEVTGKREAWLCRDCEAQLPADWAITKDEV